MTGSVTHVLMAALLFVGGHFALASQPIRSPLVARLGPWPFRGLYSLVALITIVWLIWAYARAPYVALWPPAIGLRWITFIVMPLAILLIIAGYAVSNPTVVGQEPLLAAENPAPGILAVTRHPVMWGIALWALSHIPPNGDAASLVLFASIAVLALGGAAHIDRRRAHDYPDQWPRFTAVTSYMPFAAVIQGRNTIKLSELGWLPVVLALIVFIVLLALHRWLIGVSPLPL
ncbi:MAG: NnrU family protein [Acidiferrobacterales bacterium]|nr:NnrU family protein [Acidiferrobacterales bacterium]